MVLLTAAEDSSPRVGFVKIDRVEIPEALQVTNEFGSASRASVNALRLIV